MSIRRVIVSILNTFNDGYIIICNYILQAEGSHNITSVLPTVWLQLFTSSPLNNYSSQSSRSDNLLRLVLSLLLDYFIPVSRAQCVVTISYK